MLTACMPLRPAAGARAGSGKTYTMSGREEVISTDGYNGDSADGIITRSAAYLFQAIAAAQAGGSAKYGVSASYLEIYNEGIYDLLNLKVRSRTRMHACKHAAGVLRQAVAVGRSAASLSLLPVSQLLLLLLLCRCTALN